MVKKYGIENEFIINSCATSTEEMATALARTANLASQSEVSFNKLLGMIGTVSSVTRRSAETIRRII